MTRKKAPPLPSAMLAQLVDIVCNAKSDNDIRRNAITIAYEIGKTDGRLEGAQSMADRLVPPRETSSIESSIDSPHPERTAHGSK